MSCLLPCRGARDDLERRADEALADRFRRLAGGRIERIEHELEPWEKRCHALADVLDFHKIINTEEKRRGVEALGSELIGRLSYYERWIVSFANILFEKSILTPDQLARKMDEVAARHPQSAPGSK